MVMLRRVVIEAVMMSVSSSEKKRWEPDQSIRLKI